MDNFFLDRDFFTFGPDVVSILREGLLPFYSGSLSGTMIKLPLLVGK